MSKTRILVIFTILATLFSCKPKEEYRDLEQIKKDGELTVLTMSTSTSYFIYREDTMGYHYELVRDFCKEMGLKLNIKVVENQSRLIEMLNKGEGDLIAYPVPIQNELKDSVTYAGLEQVSHQVLVQQANRGDTILKDVPQLVGKEVYTLADTKYYQRLNNLNAELGGGIVIKCIELDTVTIEDLIEMVSTKEIKYTVADELVAKLNRTYYRNINISMPISFDQRSSWAVRKTSPHLAKALDDWFTKNDNTPSYKSITKKYFELSKRPLDEDFELPKLPKRLGKGAISQYDDLFKKHAQGSNYNWQLLAAISYHESRFQNNLTSWAGASGIMGLMPRTASSLGLSSDDRMNPDLSIGAAVKLLDKLNKIFSKIEDKDERIKFILASYNGGIGHINDAMQLTRKYDANPYVWSDVRKYVLLKSNPEYYNDPVCKNGYFRGTETTRYVDHVTKTTARFNEVK